MLKQGIVPIAIEDELKRSYLDYAMSVIVSRALPDVRDGLKPVHRRILYTMKEEGFDHDKPHKKSARVVGQVISKYHPHGTDPIYGALVRLAQGFAMRICLVNGHGNFGSIDGDKAAAMRYTEVRLAPISEFLLQDYDKETVDFQPNYDDTLEMPKVLPARFPNLLVNGANGIAVGMATSIPCHNLGEVIDACCALIDEPHLEDVSAYIQGPDFPTKGIILGKKGFQEAYKSGRGSFLIRGKSHIEEIKKDREAIIVTEIPYQVNKAMLIEHIAELVQSKELEGISDLRDESDRHGMRIVIELKREAIADVILNRLYSMTALESSFNVNMLALHKEQPIQLSLLDILRAFLDFRKEVVTRRTNYFLRKTREKAHIFIGLAIAVEHIDEIIALIKKAPNAAAATQDLVARVWPFHHENALRSYLALLEEKFLPHMPPIDHYRLSEEQAKAILALRLQRLTGMECEKILQDLKTCCEHITHYLALLGSDQKMANLMKQEMQDIKAQFPSPRLTMIQEYVDHATEEDLIQSEDMVVTVSMKGYIKRVPLSLYRSQKRGGRGRNAMDTREEDEVSQVFVANTHTLLLIFTSMGTVYQLKVYELPLGSIHSRGKPLINMISLQNGEKPDILLPLPRENQFSYILFATSLGNIRKNALSDFFSIRSNGKIAMKLSSDEQLVAVCLADDDQDILLSSRDGKTIRFPVKALRVFSSRHSTGVRGITLRKDAKVVAMSLIQSQSYTQSQIEAYRHGRQELFQEEGEPEFSDFQDPKDQVPLALLTPDEYKDMQNNEQFILSISEKGYGKRTSAYAYRCAQRGGQGVATMEVTERTGAIVNTLPVYETDHIFLLTDKGQLLRCPVHDIRISSRKTQGVKLFRLAKDECIVFVALSPQEDARDEEEDPQINNE